MKRGVSLFFVIAFIFCFVTSLFSSTGSDGRPKVIVLLRYYEAPLATLQWEIAIFRVEEKAYVEVKGYKGRNRKMELDILLYNRFVETMKQEGLWQILNGDQVGESSAFYEIYYKVGVREVKFKIDPHLAHSGRLYGAPVIVRTIINYGKTYTAE